MTTDRTGQAPRILVFGATGTVGRATVQALLRHGYQVICLVREKLAAPGAMVSAARTSDALHNAEIRFGDVTNITSLRDDGFRGETFAAVVSCLASRSGAPDDAWAIDHQAHINILTCAKAAGVEHMVLLSAICVQKPRLQFQFAKLAFEKSLIESGLTYSIVRPTALFKSLSGQIDRLKAGKSFLVFGDGTLTACKPISDRDLANYLVQCLADESLHNRILPIGGPGPAITPKQQGEKLFALLKRQPRFSHVPVQLLDVIIWGLSTLGVLIPTCARKAELARIGRYYASESMLVYNPLAKNFDAAATPSTGTDLLFDHYANLLAGKAQNERGEHAVF
jgi:divinyl chlorophyllide a 8-vinyl-reductase